MLEFNKDWLVLAGLCSFFMEKQVMATFVRILRSSSKIKKVEEQLLQTLSIMIQNIRSEHAICMCCLRITPM